MRACTHRVSTRPEKRKALEIDCHTHTHHCCHFKSGTLEAACWDSQVDKQSTSAIFGPKTGSRNHAESRTTSTYLQSTTREGRRGTHISCQEAPCVRLSRSMDTVWCPPGCKGSKAADSVSASQPQHGTCVPFHPRVCGMLATRASQCSPTWRFLLLRLLSRARPAPCHSNCAS